MSSLDFTRQKVRDVVKGKKELLIKGNKAVIHFSLMNKNNSKVSRRKKKEKKSTMSRARNQIILQMVRIHVI